MSVPPLNIQATCFQLDSLGVVQAVSRGLARGENQFGVKARQILCCIRSYEDWSKEVLELGKLNI
jgi:hypothetical protein